MNTSKGSESSVNANANGYANAHAARAYWREAPDRRIEVQGHSLAYWRRGQGPDLLFIHGWPLHSATFRNVVARLEGKYTCHLIDLPGSGQTVSPSSARVAFVSHASVLQAAVDALGLSRYAIVAHDSGGLVARMLAASDARVRAVVSGDTEIPGHIAWQMYAFLAMIRAPFAHRVFQRVLASRRGRRSALAFGPCFTDPAYLDGEFSELLVEPLVRSASAMQNQLRVLRSLEPSHLRGMRRLHASLRIPVRLIWGADDTFFPIDKARAMLPQFGGPADLVAIEGGKLFVHEDHAEAFARHTDEWLTRHASSQVAAASATLGA